ncbi:MAG: DUF4843 domain-containing protein [Dysgonamonadaceae bacterium]|jgi:hypothetical protein|nr:DUF4843 domain-containing protein [Dysgonamonadaceae bacterium]
MKNNGILFMLFISLCAGMTTGCEPENPLAYQNDPAIYFNGAMVEGKSIRTQDSIAMSFAETGVDEYIFWVYVLTQGMVSDIDRPIIVKQVDKSNTAPGYDLALPGVHYVPFSDPRVAEYLNIPAGKVTVCFPVILLRTGDLLQNKKFVIDLELEPTEEFRLGMKDRLTFRIKYSGMPEKPRNWDRWNSYSGFGIWGPVKHTFILSVCGSISWDEAPSVSLGYYYRFLVRSKLAEYNAEHPGAPLCEPDGTPVTFPN